MVHMDEAFGRIAIYRSKIESTGTTCSAEGRYAGSAVHGTSLISVDQPRRSTTFRFAWPFFCTLRRLVNARNGRYCTQHPPAPPHDFPLDLLLAKLFRNERMAPRSYLQVLPGHRRPCIHVERVQLDPIDDQPKPPTRSIDPFEKCQCRSASGGRSPEQCNEISRIAARSEVHFDSAPTDTNADSKPLIVGQVSRGNFDDRSRGTGRNGRSDRNPKRLNKMVLDSVDLKVPHSPLSSGSGKSATSFRSSLETSNRSSSKWRWVSKLSAFISAT